MLKKQRKIPGVWEGKEREKKEGEKRKEKRLVEMNGMTVELDCNHRKTL